MADTGDYTDDTRHTQVVWINSLTKKKKSSIKIAAKHNLREMQAAPYHIDPTRSHLNQVIAGEVTAEGVASESSKLLADGLRKTLRHDAILGVEILFSLPVASGVDEPTFFQDCLDWTRLFFEVPVVSAVIHNDEAAPHMHVIMLPLFGGRMIGHALMGDRTRLDALQIDFNAKVGKRYGLKRATPAKRVPVAVRRQYADSVMAELKSNPSRLNEPAVKTAFLELLVSDPMAAAQALGIAIISKTTIAVTESSKPYAIAVVNTVIGAHKKQPEKVQPLSCVAVVIPEHDFNHAHDDNSNEYTRGTIDDIPEGWDEPESSNHDGDTHEQFWDGDLGEFITQPRKQVAA